MAAKARLRLDGADPINRGLFAFWPLQENAGLSVEDIGPQGKVGRITGAPLRVVTNKGRALRFDTSNTQNVDTGLLIGAPAAGTITWWQRSTQAYNSGDLDRVPWGNASDSGAGANFSCQVFFADNNWYVGWLNGTDYRVTLAASASNWPQNEWAFYAFTWGPSGSVLYQNNAVVLGSNATPPVTAESGYNFALARIGPNFVSASHFAGDMMAFRLHTRALRIPEIQRLYRDPWAGTARPRQRSYEGSLAPRTATISGTVSITGSLTTALADNAAISGTVGITGAATATLADNATIAGTVPITGSLTTQLDRLASITGTVPITGSFTVDTGASTGDTHDGFKRRSRRQRALDAAERRRREDAAEEALALRLALEAAMGEAVEAVEEAPQPVVEAVETATKQAARYVPLLAQGPSDDVLQAANEAIVALRSAVAAADRARMLAEDDEDVMMLLRAL